MNMGPLGRRLIKTAVLDGVQSVVGQMEGRTMRRVKETLKQWMNVGYGEPAFINDDHRYGVCDPISDDCRYRDVMPLTMTVNTGGVIPLATAVNTGILLGACQDGYWV